MELTQKQLRHIIKEEYDQVVAEKCWPGYQRVDGVPKGERGSCEKKTNESDEVEEGKICDKGISYVIRTDPGGKDIKRGKDKDNDGKGDLQNWSARAAQIASKYCKDPNYAKGSKKKKPTSPASARGRKRVRR